MRRLTGFGLVVVFLCSSLARADDAIQDQSLRAALAGVPTAELPAKVSELIRQAPLAIRPHLALSAVNVALEFKGGAAPAIVSAAVRAEPDMAAQVAATAARRQPKLAKRIAKAAAAAAPSRAGQIVIWVCRAVPAEYRGIALSVAEAVPSATREILGAVGTVFPDLKPAIERALANSGQKPVSVAGVLDSATLALAGGASSSRGTPVSSQANPADAGRMARPPFIPLTGKILSETATEPGRNYASP
ncbi:MAG TPA: hypothetical protein VHI52_01740 [Verrucomicrobiae bacterium]|nr:hypothetical protein [Verrucomicrobiae bacterium]